MTKFSIVAFVIFSSLSVPAYADETHVIRADEFREIEGMVLYCVPFFAKDPPGSPGIVNLRANPYGECQYTTYSVPEAPGRSQSKSRFCEPRSDERPAYMKEPTVNEE